MENLWNDRRFKNTLVTLGILLVVFVAVQIISGLKSIQYIGAGVSATNTITVSGTGDVVATPDIATFTFTVQNEAQSVSAAQKKSSDAMNAVLAYLSKAGVADADVKTTSYDIYPRYEYHQTAVPAGSMMPNYYGQGTQVLAAYVVSQSVEVKVRDLTKAGDLLSGVGQYGATNISGLSFSIDKQTDVERQARDKAIADAKQQAELLAKSLGVSLVRIVSFNESGNYPQPIYYAKAAMGMGGADSAATAPSVPAGQNKITSNVSITYEIQ